MQTDPASSFSATTMHVPVTGIGAATTLQTNFVDARGFRFAYIILSLGAVTGTGVTLDFNVEAGSVGSGTAAVDITGAAFALTSVESSDNLTFVGMIDLTKLASTDRYLSGDIVTAGSTPSVAFSSVVLLTQAEDSALSKAAAFSV